MDDGLLLVSHMSNRSKLIFGRSSLHVSNSESRNTFISKPTLLCDSMYLHSYSWLLLRPSLVFYYNRVEPANGTATLLYAIANQVATAYKICFITSLEPEWRCCHGHHCTQCISGEETNFELKVSRVESVFISKFQHRVKASLSVLWELS